MKLTKYIREDIAKSALSVFKEREEALRQREHDLGMEGYYAAFTPEDRAKALDLKEGWLREDGCLRFNAGGYNLTFTVNTPVRVPYSTPYGCGYSCNVLASIHDEDLVRRMQEFAQEKEKFLEEKKAAYRATLLLVEKFSTVKALKEAWPEGYEFYKSYDGSPVRAKLPAIRVDEINAMLGLTKVDPPAEAG